MNKPKLGISSCLLGEPVRHDGGHKRHAYTVNTLGQFFEFVPFCPEALAGLGIPRPTIRLVKAGSATRAVEVKNQQIDVTERLLATSALIVEQAHGLAGYILKKDSPSCGMARVRIYDAHGVPQRVGQGLFAQTLEKTYPNLPVEEEGRLTDPALRENFLERVYVYQRWLNMTQRGLTIQGLIHFHTQHKFLLLAHDEQAHRQLGQLVASASEPHLLTLGNEYIATLMNTLKKLATRKRHTNVLLHLSGYLRKKLSTDEKTELREVTDKYRCGIVPLVVPLTLLKHHFRQFPTPYIDMQHYIDPYPETLMLRNHL